MTQASQPYTFDHIQLFRNLNAEEKEWIQRHTQCTTYEPATTVVAAQQPGNLVYFILSGTLKIEVNELHGNVAILAIVGPGDVVGELSLLDGIGRSANVITLDQATLLWMDGTTFRKCLQRLPTFAANVVQLLCARLRSANEQNLAYATLDLRGRVVRQILALAHTYGVSTEDGSNLLALQLTQSDLAALVGGSRERVNRIIQPAKRLGYLSVQEDARIIVHDARGLARWAQIDHWFATETTGGQLPTPALPSPALLSSNNGCDTCHGDSVAPVTANDLSGCYTVVERCSPGQTALAAGYERLLRPASQAESVLLPELEA